MTHSSLTIGPYMVRLIMDSKGQADSQRHKQAMTVDSAFGTSSERKYKDSFSGRACRAFGGLL